MQQAFDAQKDLAARMQGVKAIHQDLTAAQEAEADRERATLRRTFDQIDRLTCSLQIDVAHETYTSRSFDVTTSEGLPDPAVIPPEPKQQSIFPSQVSLHDDDAQELKSCSFSITSVVSLRVTAR